MSSYTPSRSSNIDTTINIQPGNRISWLDILRGIGILLMVYGHINYLTPIYNWIYSFHMPLFFLASGVVYKERPLLEDIIHRARTIMIPYFAFGIITLSYWQLAERHYKPSDFSFAKALKGLLIGNEDALVFNIPLWFLPCFFLTLVLYNLIRRITQRCIKHASRLRKQSISFAFCIVLCVIYSLDILRPLPWGIDRIPKYIVFVAIGEMLLPTPKNGYENATTARTPVTPCRRTRFCSFLLALTLSAPSIILSNKLSYNDVKYQWYLVAGIGCTLVIALSIAIANSRCLQLCGRAALTTLCIHGAIYRALIYALSQFTGYSLEWFRTTPVIILVLALVTTVICTLAHSLVSYIHAAIIKTRCRCKQ